MGQPSKTTKKLPTKTAAASKPAEGKTPAAATSTDKPGDADNTKTQGTAAPAAAAPAASPKAAAAAAPKVDETNKNGDQQQPDPALITGPAANTDKPGDLEPKKGTNDITVNSEEVVNTSAEKYVVAKQFKDKPQYIAQHQSARVWAVGEDVSHFDSARIQNLVNRKFIKQVEKEE